MENIIIEAQFVAHINYYYAALRHSFFFLQLYGDTARQCSDWSLLICAGHVEPFIKVAK